MLSQSTLQRERTSNNTPGQSAGCRLSSDTKFSTGIQQDNVGAGRRVRMMSDLPSSKRGISTRDLNFGIPSNMAAQEHAVEIHGIDSMKAVTLRFLHQKWVQMTLLALLLLDVLILLLELLLLGGFPDCRVIVRDCVACCQESHHEAAAEGGERQSSGGEDHGEEICEAGYLNTGEASCDEQKWHVVHSLELAMFWTTICILSIFMIEILIEIWALSPSVFFRQCFYTMDFIIVSVSLILELLFHFLSRTWAEELAGFVVFFRLWRFVRIGHGIVEFISELTHEVYEELLEYTAQCEDVIKGHWLKLPETTKRVHKMVDEKDDKNHE
ncbi:hypothetical protein IV203_029807 [Nitzschia inconspicua]|uniref:Ion transport domain-containing protein n=1 Tax=Nitzschia inconspicua TaxID=303405 RepID=A0A9K3Q0P5_9STRA|nr:hypothetical protein IV203_029807 [Nitzschia inconspicua]